MELQTTQYSDALRQSAQAIQTSLLEQQLPDMTVARDQQFARLSTLVGNTTLEQVHAVSDVLLLKREFDNLSGSHYDRAYLATIRSLEQSGLIRPGDQLRDISSGSAGTSLAVISYALGYKARILVPSELPPNRLHIMRVFGAELIDSGPGYVSQASMSQLNELFKLKKDKDWQRIYPADRDMRALIFQHQNGERICYLNHSENVLSPQSFEAIGNELVEQTAQPAAVALAIGNWTTIAGISKVVRARWPGTKVIGYRGEPSANFQNYGSDNPGSAGTNVPVRFRDESLVDEIVQVTNYDRDAMHSSFNLTRPVHEQVGRTSLMGLVVSEKLAASLDGPVVSVAYDQMVRN